MSAVIDFESLNLIPQLLKKMEALEDELKEIKKEVVPELDLTKRKDVKKYLGIQEGSLKYKIESGIFKEGVHFKRVIKNKKPMIIFVESAIREYKEKQ